MTANDSSGLPAQARQITGMLLPVGFQLLEFQQLRPGSQQLAQALALGLQRSMHGWPVLAAVVAEQRRIDPISLGQPSHAAGVMSHPLGRHDTHRHGGGQRRGEQLRLISSGGFTD